MMSHRAAAFTLGSPRLAGQPSGGAGGPAFAPGAAAAGQPATDLIGIVENAAVSVQRDYISFSGFVVQTCSHVDDLRETRPPKHFTRLKVHEYGR